MVALSCTLPAMAALLLSAASAAHATLAKGKPAPAWNGKTVEGKALSSSQFKGKVVLMNFFGYT
jgi:hypothetical protein